MSVKTFIAAALAALSLTASAAPPADLFNPWASDVERYEAAQQYKPSLVEYTALTVQIGLAAAKDPGMAALHTLIRMSPPISSLDTNEGRARLRELDTATPMASLCLGLFYARTGEGQLAEFWLQRAADRGLVDAHLFLASLYLTPSLYPYSPALAAQHLQIAADAGHAVAQASLRIQNPR